MENKKNFSKMLILSQMSPVEKLERLTRWQNSDFVHPLTCGGDSCPDEKMTPVLSLKGDVELVCPKCKRIQEFIPSSCLLFSKSDFDSLEEKMNKMLKDKR